MQALILGALACLSALPLLLGDAGGNESAQVGEVKRLQAEADVAFLQMLQKMDNQEMVDSHDMALLDELMAELGQEAGLGPSPRKLAQARASFCELVEGLLVLHEEAPGAICPRV